MKNQITLTSISFFDSAQELGFNLWLVYQIFFQFNVRSLLKDKTDNHAFVMASFPLLRKSLMIGIHNELKN